ncbi:flagellar hook assembly protein FlgD [Undibacter mobilis]|uniref:Basal-body rod modification protein FlgD n=1 Tax=Undibacter mobilis TaxID=2292256 RepID=A0A371B6G7_9BRAD|nr:flagellar hook capping FlgD N-terminal domain-containing protein [Undibacter mobilis]RDV03186.1 flagellar biosynthesis protein FlgD [Undibacter mobilis]
MTTIAGSATTANNNTTSGSSSTNQMVASNFTTFLQLLTTQLKNQNPLDPLDTNQFTQQLVQFAQVEQQMKSNDQLASILALEKNAQQTTAMAYVGHTVVVDGSTTTLGTDGATWSFNAPKTATATVTIKDDATGQTAYSGTFGVNAGDQKFTWDGKGSDGKQWPPGNYTMSVTAVDASQKPVNISTEIQAVVTAANMADDPPTLTIAGKDYTPDKIKRIVIPNTTKTDTGSGNGNGNGTGT